MAKYASKTFLNSLIPDMKVNICIKVNDIQNNEYVTMQLILVDADTGVRLAEFETKIVSKNDVLVLNMPVKLNLGDFVEIISVI